MKKVFFVFAVATATLSFVACGPKPAPSTESTPNETETAIIDTVDTLAGDVADTTTLVVVE